MKKELMHIAIVDDEKVQAIELCLEVQKEISQNTLIGVQQIEVAL